MHCFCRMVRLVYQRTADKSQQLAWLILAVGSALTMGCLRPLTSLRSCPKRCARDVVLCMLA
jgi:hypothetical protein